MGYCILTGDVRVSLCCCSVGVDRLSNDLARWNVGWYCLVRFAACSYCYDFNGRISFQLRFSPDVGVEFLGPLFTQSLRPERCLYFRTEY